MANIGAFRGRFNARVGRIKKGSILRLFNAIVEDTPVLSGRLRASWQLTRGGHATLVARTSPRGKAARTGNPTAGSSAFYQKQDIEALVDEKDGTYRLTNPQPYAGRVEYEGWSPKAPQGMVRINLVKFGLILKDEVRKNQL